MLATPLASQEMLAENSTRYAYLLVLTSVEMVELVHLLNWRYEQMVKVLDGEQAVTPKLTLCHKHDSRQSLDMHVGRGVKIKSSK